MNDHEIPELLRSQDRFVVVSHANPDGDAIGSLLGMYLALREMGKKAWPLGDRPFPVTYDFLPGASDLITDPKDVDAPEWIIAVDVAEEHRISGDISSFRHTARLINIDHHPTNPAFGALNFIDARATSSAELVHKLLKEAGYRISTDVGKCLYTGLVTDTGGFRFAGVTGKTLEIAAEMLGPGLDSYEITRHLFEEYPLARLHLERIVLERAEILLDDRLILSTLHETDFSNVRAELSDGENLVNRLREFRGVRAACLITVMGNGLIRVSFRSKGNLDVAKIAQSLGGGGHRAAAGVKSTLPLLELRKTIIEALQLALNAG
ncbi:MAG: bifunctional oligoribonuclease/PAP phosphatase NrnA [Desulfomonile tiedjei]|uniref:Bifunctional oligoribonuclease/PAP phosphatase NrnA n=1 Tax=Desulfomonile tiedjei TaxID=2358 RepID=A0A9D6V3F2_9BACT|nr:bifunctional oligoribonuclease/PAP phosphatase NrnA [Desulfomonile tiedjei]